MGALHVGLLGLLAATATGEFDFDGVKASATQASPVGFFNDHGRFGSGVGSFTLGVTDHVTGPDLTYGDRAQFQARFTQGASEYRVELIRAGFPPLQALAPEDQKGGRRVPPSPAHRIDGGVMLDTDVFGSAGIGPRDLSRAHAAIAVFGVGRVFKNGKLLTDRARIEVTALSNTLVTPEGQMLLTPLEGRSQVLILADNLPRSVEPQGFLEFGFNDAQIVVDGTPVNPPARGVASGGTAGPEGAEAGTGGAGSALIGGTPMVFPTATSAPGSPSGVASTAAGGGTGTVTSPGPFIGAQPIGGGGAFGTPVPLAPGLAPFLQASPPVLNPTVSRDLGDSLNGRLPINNRNGVPASTLAAPTGNPGIVATNPVTAGVGAFATPTTPSSPGVVVSQPGAPGGGLVPVPASTLTSGTSVFPTPTLSTTSLAPQPGAPATGTPGAPAAGTPGAPGAGTPGAPSVGGPGILGLGPETTGGIASDRTSAAPGFESIGSPRVISSQTQVPGREGNAPAAFASSGIPATPEPLNAQPATPLPFTPSPLNVGPAAALPQPVPAGTTTSGATAPGSVTGAPTVSRVPTVAGTTTTAPLGTARGSTPSVPRVPMERGPGLVPASAPRGR